MYKIYADDTLIYDSTIEDYKLGKGEITLETNKAGSFVFSLYPDHFFYDRFVRLTTVITVYRRDKIVFRGRILNDVTDYHNVKTLTCEGELSFLQDSIVRPFNFNGTPENFVKQFITRHNEQVDDFKKFNIGKIEVADSNGVISRYSNIYDTTLNAFTSRTIDSDAGGYIYITHGEDGRDPIPTINWVTDFDKVSAQRIEFGVNLKSYTKTVKAEEIATAIIPLGKEMTTTEESGEGEKLTITSVNDGVDYIYSPEAVAVYGWIFKTVEFSDITIAKNLKEKAEAYLNDVILHQTTIELDAIDLNILNPEIESLSINEYINATSEPHNFDITLLCSKQTINILKADGDSYTLGYTYKSFANNNVKLSKAITQVKSDCTSIIKEKVTQTKSEFVVESGKLLSHIETTYSTRDALATGLNAVSSEISQSASQILLTVSETYATNSDLNSGLETMRSEISQSASQILLTVSGTYATSDELDEYKENINAELSLAIKTDENGNLLSAIHASTNQITIESDNFTLAADGTVTAKNINIEGGTIHMKDRYGVTIVSDVFGLSVNSPDNIGVAYYYDGLYLLVDGTPIQHMIHLTRDVNDNDVLYLRADVLKMTRYGNSDTGISAAYGDAKTGWLAVTSGGQNLYLRFVLGVLCEVSTTSPDYPYVMPNTEWIIQ